MAKVPDFLLNMTNSATNLVEDSPRFRAQENEQQIQNLTRASEEAMRMVEDETRQAQINTMNTQMGMLDSITPTPTPLTGPDQEEFFPQFEPEEDTPMTPNLPSLADFGGTSPLPLTGPGAAPEEDEDEAEEVFRIAQATGLAPEVVASMALLGEEIERIEQEKQMALPPQQEAPPALMAPPPSPPVAPPTPAPVTPPPPAPVAPVAPAPMPNTGVPPLV